MSRSSRLERVRLPLIHQLADGASQVELAVHYGVHQSSISRFAARHRDEIEAVMADRADAYAARWLANQSTRTLPQGA